MKRLFIALVASLFFLSGLVAPQAATAADTSEYGKQSIADLVTCLNTAESLDVFYLVDSSTSLEKTDPKNERTKIISEDIRRWADVGTLRPNVKIQVAGALFSESTSRISDWQDLNATNADDVANQFAKQINNNNLSNYTNWRVGLEEAFDQHETRSSDCKVVIWFTDGGLWSAPWSEKDRPKSLDDLEALCGPANKGDVTRSPSSQGIMAQMRSAGIRVFGILLNVGSDTEKDEAFYRSLMQPVIEEKGQVTSGSGLPSGEITCGENLPAEERDYATGAFLEAQSAADIAYKLIDVSIGPSTKVDCSKDGEFWVDPGIDAVEFATDASAWRITDAKGVVRASWSGSQKTTTGKIAIPDVKEPEKWKFTPAGASKICSLYVSPEIYMSLHDKSLISGKQGSITGQFVKSLTSNQIADLSVYKSVAFSAQIDGKAFDSSLNKKTGTFEIKSYTPTTSSESAKVQATLTLKTDHYNLNTLNLDKSKEIYSSGVLPEVGSIKFVSDLVGAKGKATAEVTVKAPTAQGVSSNVCFTKFNVISDGQDESAGKATNRSKNWKWTTGGLDSNGCVEFLNGTNRDQKVTFELSNPTQANARGEALFNYKISSGDIADLKDSQTAEFGTKSETSSWLFWFWFIVLLLAGLGIPFAILRYMNSKNARFTVGPGTFRGVIGIRLDREREKLLVNNETGRLTDAQVNLVFFDRTQNLVGTKTFDDGPVSATAKSPLWPLSAPQFLAVLDPTKTLIAGDLLGRFSRTSNNVQQLTYGRVSSLAYVTNDVSHNLFDDSNSFTNGSAVRLVLFVTNAYQDPAVYQEKISQILEDPEVYKAVLAITPERGFTSNVAATPDWADSTSTSSKDASEDDWFNNDDSGFNSGSKANDDF
jgi:hypothetical protein